MIIVSRFGKYVKVSQCTYERIYYDSEFGQLKDSSEKWIGLNENALKLKDSLFLINNIQDKEKKDDILLDDKWKNTDSYSEDIKKLKGIYHENFLDAMQNLFNECERIGGGSKLYINSIQRELFYNPDSVNDRNSIIGQFINTVKIKINKYVNNLENLEEPFFYVEFEGDDYKVNISNTIKKFEDISEDLKNYQNGYLDSVEHYIRVAKGWGHILVLIYFCLLSIIAILGCVLLMTYSYLKSQNKLDTMMHIIWNCIRFFVFSFFMYGAAFGMLSKGLRDLIAYNMYLFGDNLKAEQTLLLPNNESKKYLYKCLNEQNTEFISDLDDFVFDNINEISKIYREVKPFEEINIDDLDFKDNYDVYKETTIRNLEDTDEIDLSDSSYEFSDSIDSIIPDNKTSITINFTQPIQKFKEMANDLKNKIKNLTEIFSKKTTRALSSFSSKNIRSSKSSQSYRTLSSTDGDNDFSLNTFDCGFLKSDLNMVHNALYDLSIECKILCAVSCCIGFFGEILVHFYLLSMYHYNNKEFGEREFNINDSKRNNNSKIGRSIDENSKNEFMDKSKPVNMKRFNQKLDIDFSEI